MFYKKIIISSILIGSMSAFGQGNLNPAKNLFSKVKGDAKYYDKVAASLVDNGYPFTAVAFAKEFLTSLGGNKRKRSFDRTLDKIIDNVGIKQFETLPLKILRSSSSPLIRYIKAKKNFRRGKYPQALKELGGFPSGHSAAPYAAMLAGSIHSIRNQNQMALREYEKCISLSKTGDKTTLKGRNILVNKDYCLAGVARSHFADKKYQKAELAYLDIEKSSPIWPEILFEEAWNSYFLKNYNRTLGKLVSYKAPIFDHFFIPEIEILKALSYMELCLWGDAKNVVDGFYNEYFKDAQDLKRFIRRTGKDYDYYAKASIARQKNKIRGTELYNRIMNSIVNEPSYKELVNSFRLGVNELKALKRLPNSSFKRVAMISLKDTVLLQKRLIGSYVRKNLIIKFSLLTNAFSQMSFVKLEVLQRIKSGIYNFSDEGNDRKRGDIKYLKRNEKQYFWTFNGEFWADELGDYVFALKSECR